jgi:hypothetical protein
VAATTTRTIRPSDRWRERLGMTQSECRMLVAILAYHSIYRAPVLATVVRDLLVGISEPMCHKALGSIARRGWIKAVGKVGCTALYEPTDRGWRFLGLEKPHKAA